MPEVRMKRTAFNTIQISTKEDDKTIHFFSPYPAEGSFVKVSEKPEGFLAEDFKASHPDVPFIEIYDIFITPESRKQGLASRLIAAIAECYGEDTVILTAAGASMKEYKEEPSMEEMIRITESLRPFYESNNFIDVNKYYAGYESKCAYLYNNKAGAECLKQRKEEVEEFEQKKEEESIKKQKEEISRFDLEQCLDAICACGDHISYNLCDNDTANRLDLLSNRIKEIADAALSDSSTDTLFETLQLTFTSIFAKHLLEFIYENSKKYYREPSSIKISHVNDPLTPADRISTDIVTSLSYHDNSNPTTALTVSNRFNMANIGSLKNPTVDTIEIKISDIKNSDWMVLGKHSASSLRLPVSELYVLQHSFNLKDYILDYNDKKEYYIAPISESLSMYIDNDSFSIGGINKHIFITMDNKIVIHSEANFTGDVTIKCDVMIFEGPKKCQRELGV